MDAELLPPIIYRKSLTGMNKELKALQTKLSRCYVWQGMKREQLTLRIDKLKHIRDDMRLVVHMAEGMSVEAAKMYSRSVAL